MKQRGARLAAGEGFAGGPRPQPQPQAETGKTPPADPGEKQRDLRLVDTPEQKCYIAVLGIEDTHKTCIVEYIVRKYIFRKREKNHLTENKTATKG